MPSIYSPGELSYLLAGRTTEPADYARRSLGLEQLEEGDTGVLTGAQGLVAAGRATVDQGLIEIGEEAKVIGYLLGTASDWIRVSIQVEKESEGVSTVAIAFAASDAEAPGLVLRMMPLGNVEIALLDENTSIAQATIALVKGYLDNYEIATIAVQRENSELHGEVGAVRTATEPLKVVRRRNLPGADDLVHPATAQVDQAAFVAEVGTLVGLA